MKISDLMFELKNIQIDKWDINIYDVNCNWIKSLEIKDDMCVIEFYKINNN